MKAKTFEQLLDAALEAYFQAGDWRDDGTEYPPNYDTMHRRCWRARAAVIKAHKTRRRK